MLFKIAGLGAESQEKPEPFRKHFKAGSMIICDDKACIKYFASNNDMMIESPKVFIDGDSYK